MFKNVSSEGAWRPIPTMLRAHCAALGPSLAWMLIKIFYVLILISDPHNHSVRNRLLWLLLSFFIF